MKNGAGSNILEFEGPQQHDSADLLMASWRFILRTARRFVDDNQWSLNTETGLVEISDTGFQYIKTRSF